MLDSTDLPAMAWPSLVSPFDAALHLAVNDVMEHYRPIGIIAAGSVLRGQGGPTSDIDLYVLHHAPYRQRLQRRYAGVPFEIFINPPQQVRRYFEDEHAAARPITAHILTTGFIVLDRDPAVQTLRTEAAAWLAKLPAPSDDALLWRRYLIVDALDNARDIVDVDAACASLILGSAVSHLVEYAFLAHNQHLPRQKELLRALDALDPTAGATARAFYAATDIHERLRLATTLAMQLTGAVTFFAWDSAQLPV
ncbi:MAG: nucleotidyltransferase domain-containing protein [Caldilineaceae bacterium]|nr:nucleotidyltransferase domain-containing protein [Caldilineaceae bacterium]